MKFILPKVGEAKLSARVFDDKSFARCIIFNANSSEYLIIALEDIDHNGGLSKYDWYSAGTHSYKYRDLETHEIYSLPYFKKLTNKDIKQIRSIKNSFGIDIPKIIDIKRIRKEKLKRLNLYEQ